MVRKCHYNYKTYPLSALSLGRDLFRSIKNPGGKKIGALMAGNKIIIYGTEWCGDCYRARRILESNNVAFEWLDIDLDQEGENFVLKFNKGNRSVPTIIFSDGSVLVEPSYRQLKEKISSLNLID
jgi:mycoredoxin